MRYDITVEIVTKKCLMLGCGESTRENKDYCTEHIEEIPYVKSLLDMLAGHEAENNAIVAHQMTAKEILGTSTCRDIEITIERLTEAVTVEDLSFDLDMDVALTEECLMALWKAGRANLAKVRLNPASEERIIVVVPTGAEESET